VPEQPFEMSEETVPDFIVSADSDPVIIKINGKANYLNCSPMNDFFDHVMDNGAVSFLIDFTNCQGMDSTFLGVLAGVATRAMHHQPLGRLSLANLNSQNKQLIRGLGLHHLPTVEFLDEFEVQFQEGLKQERINDGSVCKEASAEIILEAHERLMKLNRANEKRFQDVVKFLRSEAEKSTK